MVVVGANDRGGHTPTTRMIQCESQEPQKYDLGCAQTIQFVEWAILFDMTTVRLLDGVAHIFSTTHYLRWGFNMFGSSLV